MVTISGGSSIVTFLEPICGSPVVTFLEPICGGGEKREKKKK